MNFRRLYQTKITLKNDFENCVECITYFLLPKALLCTPNHDARGQNRRALKKEWMTLSQGVAT